MSANKLLTSINTKEGIQQDRTPETSRLSVSSTTVTLMPITHGCLTVQVVYMQVT